MEQSTEQLATPRPWTSDVACVWGPSGLLICDTWDSLEAAEANAALIVRAVNAHDELVAVLTVMIASHGVNRWGEECGCNLCEAARAALALAEGRQA